MHSVLGAQQAIRAWAGDDERRALQSSLLTTRLIDDLGLEAAPLRPLEVHAQQHLDPVLSLHPTLADGDGDHGVVAGVRIREQQVQLMRAQLLLDRGPLLLDLALEVALA